MTQKSSNWEKWRTVSLMAAVVATICAISFCGETQRLWRAYLFAFFVIWLITMGAMSLLALGNLTGGRWALAARPFYLAITATLPIVVILFLPIAFGLSEIYPWAQSGDSSAMQLPPSKAMYFARSFVYGRAITYLMVWLIAGRWLDAVSRSELPPASTASMRRAGAICLVLLVPTVTFAAFDWGMSLEPEWYSSIYGGILAMCGVVAAHALSILGYVVAKRANNDGEFVRDDRKGDIDVLNDLGNLLLAFVMVATYFAFAQFLIIWSGNLPSETAWYVRRIAQGWQWMALGVVLLHFAVPFSMLLSREVKRTPRGWPGSPSCC